MWINQGADWFQRADNHTINSVEPFFDRTIFLKIHGCLSWLFNNICCFFFCPLIKLCITWFLKTNKIRLFAFAK